MSNSGGGISRYGDLAINRWRNDGTRDDYGQWCYLRDVTTGRVWSAAHQPVCAEPSWYRVLFASDRVTFHRRDDDIETVMEIAVAPGEAAEVRKITRLNTSPSRARSSSRAIWKSCSPVRIPIARTRHSRTSSCKRNGLPGSAALLAMRRPRSATDKPNWCGHVVATAFSTEAGDMRNRSCAFHRAGKVSAGARGDGHCR